jgi:hypothetical protein
VLNPRRFHRQAGRVDGDRRAETLRRPRRVPIGGVDVADQRLGDYELEGVAARPEGRFWFASEGRTNVGSSRPNLILRTNASGTVLDAVALPASLVARATSSGLEGIAVSGTTAGGDEVVWVAVQREWGDDSPGFVKLGRYDVATATWSFARYPLDAVESPAGGFVGLSELTLLGDGTLAVIERDNQLGQDARIKRIYAVDPSSVEFVPHDKRCPCCRSICWPTSSTSSTRRASRSPTSSKGSPSPPTAVPTSSRTTTASTRTTARPCSFPSAGSRAGNPSGL